MRNVIFLFQYYGYICGTLTEPSRGGVSGWLGFSHVYPSDVEGGSGKTYNTLDIMASCLNDFVLLQVFVTLLVSSLFI